MSHVSMCHVTHAMSTIWMNHVAQASLVARLEQLHQSINKDKEKGRKGEGGARRGENGGNGRRESETSEWGGSAYEV